MVVDVWFSAYAVLEPDVQVIPEAAVQHRVSHHPDPVFNLTGGNIRVTALSKHDAKLARA